MHGAFCAVARMARTQVRHFDRPAGVETLPVFRDALVTENLKEHAEEPCQKPVVNWYSNLLFKKSHHDTSSSAI